MREIIDHYIETSFDGPEQASFKMAQFERNYRRHFPSRSDARLLDIGIGRGEMLSCMKSWGYQNFFGVDISVSAVRFCQNLGLPCSQVKDVREWIESEKKHWSVISLLDVLEHFEKNEVIPFLQSIRGCLEDEGTLLIQVPNLQSPDSNLHRYGDFTHSIGFTEHSLSQVLLASGFKKFQFVGFEESLSHGLRYFCKKTLRALYWRWVKLTRKMTGNLNPEILSPVLIAVVKK